MYIKRRQYEFLVASESMDSTETMEGVLRLSRLPAKWLCD